MFLTFSQSIGDFGPVGEMKDERDNVVLTKYWQLSATSRLNLSVRLWWSFLELHTVVGTSISKSDITYADRKVQVVSLCRIWSICYSGNVFSCVRIYQFPPLSYTSVPPHGPHRDKGCHCAVQSSRPSSTNRNWFLRLDHLQLFLSGSYRKQQLVLILMASYKLLNFVIKQKQKQKHVTH